jgi:hypothetical protein
MEGDVEAEVAMLHASRALLGDGVSFNGTLRQHDKAYAVRCASLGLPDYPRKPSTTALPPLMIRTVVVENSCRLRTGVHATGLHCCGETFAHSLPGVAQGPNHRGVDVGADVLGRGAQADASARTQHVRT